MLCDDKYVSIYIYLFIYLFLYIHYTHDNMMYNDIEWWLVDN